MQDDADREHLLKEKTELLDAILECTPDGIVACDREANFLVFNRAAENMIGVGAIDINVERWSESYGCYSDEGETPLSTSELPLVRALSGKEVNGLEVFIRNERNQTGTWLSCNGSPISKEGSGQEGALVVFRDITSFKRAREAARLRDELIITIVHDLKNALAAAELNLPPLLDGAFGPVSDKQAAVISGIKRMNEDLWTMAKSVLELFRYEDREALGFEIIDAASVIEPVVRLLSGFAESHRVNVEWQAPDEHLEIRADPLALGHVINNLIHNAIKFSPENGRVTVLLSSDSTMAHIAVSDSGPGMSEAVRANLFGRQRALESGASDKTSTGLGLYLCRRIVDAHGGKLSASSGHGWGSTFTVSLALAETT